MLRLAHISDVHLAPVRGLAPWHLNIKRTLGLGNWLLKRRKVHLRSIVDALVADLHKQTVDHIIVSGDLVNLGLPGEYAAALNWLQDLGTPERVTVVPGNHDIYCALRRDIGIERWRDYMTSNADGSSFAQSVERGFPFVRIIGNVAVVGVVSAIPTAPFYAIGEVGHHQCDALGKSLKQLGQDGFIRVVVIHHPPLPGQADSRRGLRDAEQLQDVLLSHGAELVLHGHNHQDMHETRTHDHGRMEVVGVASASMGRAYKDEPLGRYNIIQIDGDATGPVIDIATRGLDQPDGHIIAIGSRRLSPDSETTSR